jgi:hypothetical protein
MDQIIDFERTSNEFIAPTTSDSVEIGTEQEQEVFVFNTQKYEKNQETEFHSWHKIQAVELCNRYIDTIEKRRKKLIKRNIENMMYNLAVYSKPKIQSNPTSDDQHVDEPSKKSWDMSWKSRPVISVVTPPTTTVSQDSDISNEELVSFGRKTSPGKTSGKKPQAKHQRLLKPSHQQPIQKQPINPPIQKQPKFITPTNSHTNPPVNPPIQKQPTKPTPVNPPIQKQPAWTQPATQPAIQPATHSTVVSQPAKTQAVSQTKSQPSAKIPVQQAEKQSESVQSVKNLRSRMCKFTDKCRRRDTCTFAHSIDEFTPIQCKFAACRSFDNCRFFHPSIETKQSYIKRSANLLSEQ